MTNTDYKDTNTSWFTENWEEIRKELIKDVEKVNKRIFSHIMVCHPEAANWERSDNRVCSGSYTLGVLR